MPFEGARYVSDTELKLYYSEYMKYPHQCDECGDSMHIVGYGEELKCTKCKVKLETEDFICCD